MLDTIIAGDALDFDTTVTDSDGTQYLPADGWTMLLRLIPQTSGTPIEIPTTASADDSSAFNCAVTSATTAAWGTGTYGAFALVTLSGERKTVYIGQVVIKADPGLASTYDVRSSAKVALDAALTLYYDFVSNRVHVLEYEVAGRRMKFTSADQLVKHIEALKKGVAEEETAARIASGQSSGRKVYTRFAQ